MIYNGIELKTMGEIFNKALELAKNDKNEAAKFFKCYIEYIYNDNNNINVNSLEEATRIAKSNFGYFAGYYNQKVCDIIYKTYQCTHPIFGDKPFDVSPEEAFRKGQEMAKKFT